MAAESDPHCGSVMAIDAQLPAKRSSCSSSATEAMAELPRPWRGMDSSRPTSPQHISMIDSAVDMLVPLVFLGVPFRSVRRTPAAPAPPVAEDAFSPSTTDASRSSSLG